MTDVNQNHVVLWVGSERRLVCEVRGYILRGLEDTNKMAADERWWPGVHDNPSLLCPVIANQVTVCHPQTNSDNIQPHFEMCNHNNQPK